MPLRSLEEIWYSDRRTLALFKRFADAYAEYLREMGWLDDWLRWGRT